MYPRLIRSGTRTCQAVDDYVKATGKVPGEFLFTSRWRVGEAMTTRQYARLVAEWIAGIGLDPHIFATHSLRRTKATLIYRRTGNLRAVQLLLGLGEPPTPCARPANVRAYVRDIAGSGP